MIRVQAILTEEQLVGLKKVAVLIDCVSFAAMRHLGIAAAFTFDRHCAEQGFEIIP